MSTLILIYIVLDIRYHISSNMTYSVRYGTSRGHNVAILDGYIGISQYGMAI